MTRIETLLRRREAAAIRRCRNAFHRIGSLLADPVAVNQLCREAPEHWAAEAECVHRHLERGDVGAYCRACNDLNQALYRASTRA